MWPTPYNVVVLHMHEQWTYERRQQTTALQALPSVMTVTKQQRCLSVLTHGAKHVHGGLKPVHEKLLSNTPFPYIRYFSDIVVFYVHDR